MLLHVHRGTLGTRSVGSAGLHKLMLHIHKMQLSTCLVRAESKFSSSFKSPQQWQIELAQFTIL